MADLTKTGSTNGAGLMINGPSLATLAPPPNCLKGGLVAGEAIAPFDACYIKNDGKVWRATGAAANAAANVRGFAAKAASVGEAVTLVHNVMVYYSTGLTPGASYFLSATAGALADAASIGGTTEIAYAVDANRIWIKAL